MYVVQNPGTIRGLSIIITLIIDMFHSYIISTTLQGMKAFVCSFGTTKINALLLQALPLKYTLASCVL